MTLFVDEVGCYDGVSAAADPVGVARAGIDLDANETVAEFSPQRFETLAWAHGVGGKAQAKDAAPRRDALLDDLEVCVGYMKRGPVGRRYTEGQRRLAENRSHDCVIDHQ